MLHCRDGAGKVKNLVYSKHDAQSERVLHRFYGARELIGFMDASQDPFPQIAHFGQMITSVFQTSSIS